MAQQAGGEIPEDILSVCIAYEQGFGKGLEMSKHTNPYPKFDHQWWAWDYGFSEGARKRTDDTLKDMQFKNCKPVTHQ